jgi:hypothetical protein
MSRRGHPAQPVEVLEAETWDAPDSLSEEEWRAHAGWDGRSVVKTFDDEEDER